MQSIRKNRNNKLHFGLYCDDLDTISYPYRYEYSIYHANSLVLEAIPYREMSNPTY